MPANPTEAQKEASRRNGATSQGPTTPTGKARSSQNNLKHGLRAATVVLCNESLSRYNDLRDSYLNRFLPADQFEHDLVIQMVNARWRLRRLYSHECALTDLEMFVQKDDLAEVFAKIDTVTAQALAAKAIAVHDPSIAANLNRQENRYCRQLERAHRMLLLERRNRTSEPGSPTSSKTISSPESTTSGPTASAPTNTEPETGTGESRVHDADFVPDSNATEEDEYQRYEYQPDWRPADPQSPSRIEEILSPKLRKPGPDTQ